MYLNINFLVQNRWLPKIIYPVLHPFTPKSEYAYVRMTTEGKWEYMRTKRKFTTKSAAQIRIKTIHKRATLYKSH